MTFTPPTHCDNTTVGRKHCTMRHKTWFWVGNGVLKTCLSNLCDQQPARSSWKDSWRLWGEEVKPMDTTEKLKETSMKMKITEVFLPGWTKSWLISAGGLEEEPEWEKSWSSCWENRQQIRWAGSIHTLFVWNVCQNRIRTHTSTRTQKPSIRLS